MLRATTSGIGCYGNSDGNYQVVRYSDADGWIGFGGAADGWGMQVATDSAGTPWLLTAYNGGASRTIFRGDLDADGTPVSWTKFRPRAA